MNRSTTNSRRKYENEIGSVSLQEERAKREAAKSAVQNAPR
jgi:hypothetical protein